MNKNIFQGCIPALMTPCDKNRLPDFVSLVSKAEKLVAKGMNGVVYCGSMGDWPLLSDSQRQEGVKQLCVAGIPVIVGTGAQNSSAAAAHATHAQAVGAKGLMVIPRVLSRGSSIAAQRSHFAKILSAAPDLPAVIYNSPYYGFETRADLFFDLLGEFPNLVGFKEFGGAQSLSYAAENITNQDDSLLLMVGVDTQVFHGYVNCGAKGAITGVGNVLPDEVITLLSLCSLAQSGDVQARRYAKELDDALHVLSTFDEGPDLVLFYKYLLTLIGEKEYEFNFDETDGLSSSQKRFAEEQLQIFQAWWLNWEGTSYCST